MARIAFERLDVYRLSEKLSDSIWELADAWRTFAKDTVGKQIVRAADSVGANIAEGTERGTPKDNCRFIQIARGSLYETVHFLRRAYKRKLLTDAQIKRIQPLITELGPRLNAYLSAVDRRHRKTLSSRQRQQLNVVSSNIKPQTSNLK
jgi:four helix bundle protein